MKLLLSLVFAALFVVDVPIASAQIPRPIHFLVQVNASQLPKSGKARSSARISARGKHLAEIEGNENSDLELNDLWQGQTYTAIPDGAGSVVLSPNDGVASVSSGGSVDIVGEKNAIVSTSFVLPQRLYRYGDTNKAFMTVRFDSMSAAWGSATSQAQYFNPHDTTAISLDSSGMATIVFGGIFDVGTNLDAASYEGEASFWSSGDTVAQRIRFYVTVTGFTVLPGTIDLELWNFVPGRTYTATPDGAGFLSLTPNDGKAEVATAGVIEYTSAVHQQIQVSFILPQRLYPTGGTGHGFINVRFDSTSAAWGKAGAETTYFNPHDPLLIKLDPVGKVSIVLGGIFEVDSMDETDAYEGEALVTAQNVTSVDRSSNVPFPKSSELYQNYPNPFNPTTTFRYQIATSSHVLLRIFDVLGRVVVTLVNEMRAPGEYVAKWDASSQMSGVYYYKLEAGSYSEVKKLVLMR